MDDKTRLTQSEFTLQLLSSIRSLDGRIDELISCAKNGMFTPEAMEDVKKRVIRLKDCRMTLINVLMDTRLKLNKELDANLDFDYDDLRRPPVQERHYGVGAGHEKAL
jgi:hypothetical protein